MGVAPVVAPGPALPLCPASDAAPLAARDDLSSLEPALGVPEDEEEDAIRDVFYRHVIVCKTMVLEKMESLGVDDITAQREQFGERLREKWMADARCPAERAFCTAVVGEVLHSFDRLSAAKA